MGCLDFRTVKPSFDDLDLLARVVRRGGFRAAAAELGTSPSRVSDRIRALEDAVGARLVNRTTRSVSATEAGEALLARAGPLLDDLAEAVAAVGLQPDAPVGRLRINAPGAAAIALGPLLGPFLKAHPGIRMEVTVEDAFSDVIGQGFDAGVRYGERLAKDMIAVPLGPPERYVLVAAPALIERTGVPRRPDDARDLPAVLTRLPGGVVPWEFERNGALVRFVPEARLTVNGSPLGLAAARDGLGFYMTFEAWAEPDIRAGRLATVLDDWLPPFPGPFLYYPSRRHPPPALKAFLDWLRAVKPAARRA